MDLRDYPRPKDDTGIGVHWNAGFAAAIGLGEVERIWLPRLYALGVKWVKIANHDGALDFVQLLLRHDIMPIVRIYRPQPNPGTLGERELQAVSDFVTAGVRYIEFNNEPDLGVEWQGGEVPPDAEATVARTAITDIEAVLRRGGYPGIPALRPGGRWDLVGEICRLGRRDLFSQPVWQAIHNYSANHPLDYPYDRANQEGAPCSRELFDKLAIEKWDGDAWEGWSLERLNQFRIERSNPGATAVDDPTCWRGYERYDALIRRQIGRSLPILATENGFVVGERQDKRYPATTPQLHGVQTLEACRIMMGTSRIPHPRARLLFLHGVLADRQLHAGELGVGLGERRMVQPELAGGAVALGGLADGRAETGATLAGSDQLAGPPVGHTAQRPAHDAHAQAGAGRWLGRHLVIDDRRPLRVRRSTVRPFHADRDRGRSATRDRLDRRAAGAHPGISISAARRSNWRRASSAAASAAAQGRPYCSPAPRDPHGRHRRSWRPTAPSALLSWSPATMRCG